MVPPQSLCDVGGKCCAGKIIAVSFPVIFHCMCMPLTMKVGAQEVFEGVDE